MTGRPGVRTHGTIAMLLGAAARGGSRRSVIGELADAVMDRGRYEGSTEQLTPILRDPPSLLPAAFVGARLLISPGGASKIAKQAVANYSLDLSTLDRLAILRSCQLTHRAARGVDRIPRAAELSSTDIGGLARTGVGGVGVEGGPA